MRGEFSSYHIYSKCLFSLCFKIGSYHQHITRFSCYGSQTLLLVILYRTDRTIISIIITFSPVVCGVNVSN